MMRGLSHPSVHPAGEQPPVEDKGPPQGVRRGGFAGPVQVEWDTGTALTPLGQLPFFIDFLKAAGRFDARVADCPLRYTSPNAPNKRDVLGTAMLSMLSGHKRYAHIAAGLRQRSVRTARHEKNSQRGRGIAIRYGSRSTILSRRAFAATGEEEGAA